MYSWCGANTDKCCSHVGERSLFATYKRSILAIVTVYIDKV